MEIIDSNQKKKNTTNNRKEKQVKVNNVTSNIKATDSEEDEYKISAMLT